MRRHSFSLSPTPSNRLILLLLCMVAGYLFCTLLLTGLFTLGRYICEDYPFESLFSHPTFLKIYNAFCSLFTFALPAYWVRQMNASPLPVSPLATKGYSPWLLAIGIVFSIGILYPGVNLLASFNQALSFPSLLSSVEDFLRRIEMQSMQLTEELLQADNLSTLLLNLTCIALFPAITEEWLFRGCLQPIFYSMTRKPLYAILWTAALFSAIHGQFFSFLPRFFLGIYLGYLFYYTQRLAYPILAHFCNNAICTLIAYGMQHGLLPDEAESWGSVETMWVGIVSITLFFLIQFILFRKTARIIS